MTKDIEHIHKVMTDVNTINIRPPILHGYFIASLYSEIEERQKK